MVVAAARIDWVAEHHRDCHGIDFRIVQEGEIVQLVVASAAVRKKEDIVHEAASVLVDLVGVVLFAVRPREVYPVLLSILL